MTPSISLESLYFGPLSPEWTISDLLDWIGADDARCHDERLTGLVDAVQRAFGSGAGWSDRGVAWSDRGVAADVRDATRQTPGRGTARSDRGVAWSDRDVAAEAPDATRQKPGRSATRSGGGVVVRVRHIAARVAEMPAAGARTLGDAVEALPVGGVFAVAPAA